MIDLCAIGDLKWLTILSVPHFPTPGMTTLLTGIERLIGNDAAIVAILAARLEMQCQLLPINTISEDGQPLIDLLHKARVGTTYVHIDGAVTPATFCLLQPSDGLRTWLVEKSAFLPIVILDEPLECTFAYFDLYDENLKERLEILRRWSNGKVRCLVNLSTTQHELKLRLLSHIAFIDTLQISCNLSKEDALSFGCHALQICQAKAVVITLGSVGSMLVDQNDAYFIEAEHVKPRRTIGLGASYSAGFLSALKGGATYREAVVFASKNAASFCTAVENPLQV